MKEKNQNMNFRDYFNIVKKRKSIVLTFFIVVISVVCFGTFTATPTFEASTKVLIEKARESNLTPGSRYSIYDPDFYETQYQLIKSRAVALRTVKILSLSEDFERLNNPGVPKDSITTRLKGLIKGTVSKIFPFLNSNKTVEEKVKSIDKEEKISRTILGNLSVTPISGTRIVNISYMSPSPELSSLVANTIAKAYIEETLNMKMEATRRTLQWMTEKAQKERHVLEVAEKKLQEYRGANDMLSLENRVTVLPEKLSEISTQLIRAESERKNLAALSRQIANLKRNGQSPETIAEIASDQALQTLRAQIVISEKNIMELSGKYGSKHPVMRKARADLRTLERKKKQEVQRIIQSINNRYELSKEKERSLAEQLKDTKGEAFRLNERSIQHDVLKRDVETNRQLYDALMLKMKEQSITREDNPVNLWIVEQAQTPTLPARPMVGLNLSLGLIVGLLGGICFAIFIEYLDNTVKDPEAAESILDVPVLGLISQFKGKSVPPEDIVLKEPRSAYAESYKALRTALLLSSAETPPQKILITSAGPGEGKTTTAVNLAIALAQSEHRVLLIDGDLRKPRIHQIFKLNNGRGLSTYLAGISGGDSLQKGPLANLAVMPSGPIPPNPSELLISNRMKILLENLGPKFDVIICDSPPILALADARNLSRVFDGAMLVARAKHTTYEQAAKALKTLHGIKGTILGLVINGQDLKENQYYYSEYYKAYDEAELQKVSPEKVGTQTLP